MEGTLPFSSFVLIVTAGFSFYALYVNPHLLDKFALNPYKVAHLRAYSTVFTSGLIHANLPHLIFNMITLYFFGPTLEGLIGGLRFILIYVVALIVGNLSTVIKHKNNYDYRSVGASGAISGVLFSYILLNPFSGIMIFPIPFPLPAFIFAILYLLWSYFASKRGMDMINHDAHIWGAVAGIVTTILLVPEAIGVFISNF